MAVITSLQLLSTGKREMTRKDRLVAFWRNGSGEAKLPDWGTTGFQTWAWAVPFDTWAAWWAACTSARCTPRCGPEDSDRLRASCKLSKWTFISAHFFWHYAPTFYGHVNKLVRVKLSSRSCPARGHPWIIDRPLSSLVVGVEGSIGPSRKLLCLF